MKLNDKRTPTCPCCGKEKLEIDDVTDHWVTTDDDGTEIFVELCVGYCPNCDRTYQWEQKYSHDPIGYTRLQDEDGDEVEEDENADLG